MAVRRELDPVRQPVCEIANEMTRRADIACADLPEMNRLCLRDEGDRCPDVAPVLSLITDLTTLDWLGIARGLIFIFMPLT